MYLKPNLKDSDVQKRLLTHMLVHSYSLRIIPPKVEFATVAIFCYPFNKKVPKQIGSGVAVCLGGEFFIFSAAHVFDDIGDRPVIVSYIGGKKLVSLCGDRFSSGKLGEIHINDPIDASVFHIQSNIDEDFKKIFLNYYDLDFPLAELKFFSFIQENYFWCKI